MGEPTLQFWPTLLGTLTVQIPYLLIAVAGLVFARLRLKPEHAKARRWATIGLGLLILRVALKGYTTARAMVVMFADAGKFADEDKLNLASSLTKWNFCAEVLLLAAIACLVVATLANRAR